MDKDNKNTLKFDEAIEKQAVDMTVGNIPRHLLAFSVPMLIGNLVEFMHNIINAVWIGRGLGKDELAAMTVSFAPIFVLVAVSIGLSLGASILMSQFFGAKDYDRVRKTVGTTTLFMLILGTIITIVGEIWAPTMTRLMNTPPEIFRDAVIYTRVFLTSLPFGFVLVHLSSLLRGIGDSKTPLYFQVVALVINTVLDPFLIFGWLGFPRWGLHGAAAATVIAQIAATIGLIVYLHKRDSIAALRKANLIHFDWHIAWLNIKIGFPSVIQYSIISLAMFAVTGIINRFGAAAAAAFGACGRLDTIAFLPALTFGASVATMTGQNIGAQKYRRVKKVFAVGVGMSAVISAFGTLVAVLFPHFLLKIFTTDPQVIDIGTVYLRTVGPAYILFSLMFAANGVLNGAGYTFIVTCISLFSICGARVPLCIYFANKLNSVNGVWYGMLCSFVVGTVLSLIMYASGLWKKPIIR